MFIVTTINIFSNKGRSKAYDKTNNVPEAVTVAEIMMPKIRTTKENKNAIKFFMVLKYFVIKY